ncbi:MAG: glutaredoxin family protein [Deltaproteobacteria bacterium]|nr:glutaredoxin family protein [Deltaproteobacteria bacterium]
MPEEVKKVLIFGKDTCPYTVAAREDYAKRGFEVEYVNVEKDPKGMKKMFTFSGGKRVPVIIEKAEKPGERIKVTIGFGGACGV